MKMKAHTVHRYMSLVQCPVCRYRYMEEGEACCWDCRAELDPDTSPEALAQDHERLHAAVERLHAARLEAEADAGALGSMTGMGFAPAWLERDEVEVEAEGEAPQPERPLPVFAPTYATDTGWRGHTGDEADGLGRDRTARPFENVEVGHIVLGTAGGVIVLSLVLFALAALAAVLALGAMGFMFWLLMRELRR